MIVNNTNQSNHNFFVTCLTKRSLKLINENKPFVTPKLTYLWSTTDLLQRITKAKLFFLMKIHFLKIDIHPLIRAQKFVKDFKTPTFDTQFYKVKKKTQKVPNYVWILAISVHVAAWRLQKLKKMYSQIESNKKSLFIIRYGFSKANRGKNIMWQNKPCESVRHYGF